MLFCIINHFHAYGNLLGYNVKGHKECPICEEDITSQQLKHGRKTTYLRHKRFLRSNHPYRRFKKDFNDHQENDSPPTPFTGVEIYEKVNNIHHTFGNSKKKSSMTNIWKKKSIFFNLPYWSKLEVKHCTYIMHVEKNVWDNLIGTFFNINGKTKDGLNAHLDLLDMTIRGKLTPIQVGKSTYLPQPLHHAKRKKSFC